MKDVVFDLGKVLLDWDPRNLFVRHLGLPADATEKFLTEICTPQWHIEFDKGRTFTQGIDQLRREHPSYEDWIVQYGEHWPGMFAGTIEAAVETVNRLHKAGIRVHALSNYPPQKIRFLYERFEFMRLFHTVVISGLLRIVKPDPEIFHRLFASIGTDRCVFIDDRLENIEAASALGVEVIHFTPADGPQRLAALVASLENLD